MAEKKRKATNDEIIEQCAAVVDKLNKDLSELGCQAAMKFALDNAATAIRRMKGKAGEK